MGKRLRSSPTPASVPGPRSFKESAGRGKQFLISLSAAPLSLLDLVAYARSYDPTAPQMTDGRWQMANGKWQNTSIQRLAASGTRLG
jgi:hypothetical protein